MESNTAETPKDIGAKVSSALYELLEFDNDFHSLAVHTATEIDFYINGIDAGTVASSRFAKLISNEADRKIDIEKRMQDFSFDPVLATAAGHAFRDSGYTAPNEQQGKTSELLRKIDAFAVELENIKNTSRSRLQLLKKTCLKFLEYLPAYGYKGTDYAMG